MELEDRRVRKTKRQIRTAITSLLLEKDASHITVRDVSETADINRGTFYSHYRDVDDLLGQLEDELLHHIDEVGARTAAHRNETTQRGYLTDLFTVIGEYSDIFYSLYCRSGNTDFQDRVFSKLKYQYLYDYLARTCGGETSYLDYYADFFVAGTCTLLRTWIESGMMEKPEELAEIARSIVLGKGKK